MPGRLFRQLEMCMIKWGTIRSVVLLYGGACRLRGEKGGGGGVCAAGVHLLCTISTAAHTNDSGVLLHLVLIA